MYDSAYSPPCENLYHSGILSPDSGDDFIAIRNFMICEGGLNLNASLAPVYSLIYSFSQDDQGVFCGSLAYIQARTNLSRSSVIRAIKKLLEEGLIYEVGNYQPGNNRETRCYRANIDRADAAKIEYRRFWQAKRDENPRSFTEFPSGVILTPEEQKNPELNEKDFSTTLSPAETQSNNVENLEKTPSGVKLTPEESPANVENTPFRCQIETGSGVKLTPYKKGLKKESIQPSNPPEADLEPGLEDGRMDGSALSFEFDKEKFQALQNSSVNRNLIRQAEEPYRALLAKGIDPDLISQAWNDKQVACKARQTDAKFYPQLKKWLESAAPDGALSACRALAKRAEEEAKPSKTERYLKLRIHFEDFNAILERTMRAADEYKLFGRGNKEEIDKQWQEVEELAQTLERRIA